MFGLGPLSKSQRLLLGILVLLVVDVIWVATSELTQYIFNESQYDKPYFITYIKSSMFVLYLSGFLCWKGWCKQCSKHNGRSRSPSSERLQTDTLLSEPVYVPVRFDSMESKSTSGASSDTEDTASQRSVRFNNVSEVRQLSDMFAEEAILARLSWSAYVRAEEMKLRSANQLTVKQVAKAAILFCLILFFGNLSYQEALRNNEAGVVNSLASTSALFVLVLAAIFPSSSGDRFTLSKFVAVLLSIGGVVLVSMSNQVLETEVPIASLWALSGAVLYALFLVFLRRRAENEDKLNMPMFLGFMGFFTMLLLWPGFFVVHFSRLEHFEWPSGMQWIFLVVNGLIGTVLSELLWLCGMQWIFLVVNGLIGTVLSELLWLWGCFLTTSLIATLSLSLTIPMTMLVDLTVKDVRYNWTFYVGIAPVFLAFFAVSVLSHYDNWDPVLLALRRLSQCIWRKRFVPRMRDLDREQTETLLHISSDRDT